MTTEIPEIFKALLEHPFTLPNFDDDGKQLASNWEMCFAAILIQCTRDLVCFCAEATPEVGLETVA